MTRKCPVAIAVLLLVLVACSTPKNEDYFPVLSKGQQWEYSVEIAAPSAGPQVRTLVHRVEDEETINGKTYTRTVADLSGPPYIAPEINYYRRTPEGIYRIQDKYKQLPELLEQPFPLTIGKTWVVTDPDGTYEYKVEGFELVVTPDRQYEKCMKISFKNKDPRAGNEGVSYYASGIGEVKNVMIVSGITFTSVLGKYKL